MGLEMSFHRTRRKTGPLLESGRDRGRLSDDGELAFDDMNLNDTNPFLASRRSNVIPHSLKHFMEADTEICGHVSFYSDTFSCVTLQQDELCFVCNVYSTSTDMFTCRVCMKSFHEGCLQKLGDLSFEVAKLRASVISKSAVGWSCYKCSNLSLLLTDEEMHEIMNLFDDYDVNQDTQISFEEFMQYKEKQYKKVSKGDCPEDVKSLFRDEFAIVDRSKSGTIDWWEFLNHESVKMLSKRDKDELVELLSEKEVEEVKNKFAALDIDKDGRVTEYEAKAAFSQWFGKMSVAGEVSNQNGTKRTGSTVLSDSDTQCHAHNLTMLVMEADCDRNRYVDWPEFLQNEALYIIASRPNLPMPLLMKKQ